MRRYPGLNLKILDVLDEFDERHGRLDAED
jgi:hypothetical protein